MASSKINRVLGNLKALLKYPFILNQLKKEVEVVFFFPFWHVGGAERVHIDIINVFKDYKTLCFITNKSKDNKFKSEFAQHCNLIELGRWNEKKAFKKIILNKISQQINQKKSVVVFGCNSPFLYDLIPFFSNHVKVIDLIHAFSDNEDGMEYYSIPYVDRITKRIVLGDYTKQNLVKLYDEKRINKDYTNRIEIIKNKVDVLKEPFLKDNIDSSFEILFVGRNSQEKRVNIFIEIAKKLYDLDSSVRFKMIGDFKDLEFLVSPNVELIGEIQDKRVLNEYYKNAHLILITSYREGFPMVILEAMLYGTVPISTNVGEISQYISEGRSNGILIENHTDVNLIVTDFINKILMLNADRSLYQNYSKAAMKVSEDFSPEIFEKKYKSVFFDC